MVDRLGPLEFTDGLWVVGDPAGKHLKLMPQGISYWVKGVESQLVEWPRLMDLGLDVMPSRWQHSMIYRILASTLLVNYVSGFVGLPATLGGTLRNPYEDWGAVFSHHARKYPSREIDLLTEFLKQVVKRGDASRLGDSQWVAAMVERLSRISGKTSRSRRQEIQEILEQDTS